MRVTISKQALSNVLGRISSIADRKSSMPILSNVLVDATSGNRLRLATTDLNISSTATVPAEVLSTGAITVPAKTFHDVVRNMPEGALSLVLDGEMLVVTGGRSHFRLLVLPAIDFPHLPDASGANLFDIEAWLLSSMIARTSFSISADETRPHINGALFQGQGKVLRMVTTDGHRLSRVEHRVEESHFYNFSMVVPAKGVAELKKAVDDGGGQVFLGTGDGLVFLRREIELEKGGEGVPALVGELTVTAKLGEAEFPPYEQVIPANQDKTVVAGRVAFLEALRRVSLVSADRTLGVKMKLSSGQLDIVSDNPAVGQGSEIVDVAYDGDGVAVGFNARYFIDILSAIGDDEIRLELAGSLDPAVVRDSTGSFVGVVMPMRI